MKYIILLFGFIGLAICQSCTYESNIDYFGNDLSTTPAFTNSIEACCILCSQTSSCAAWTFLPATGACWLKYAVGSRRYSSEGRYSGVRQNSAVYPTAAPTQYPTQYPTAYPTSNPQTISQVTTTQSTTIPTPTTPSAPSTTRPSPSPSSSTRLAGCFVETEQVNYAGNDLAAIGSVPSASDCCNLCGSTNGCVVWSYYVEYEYCYLKSSDANKDPYPGFTSGRVVA